MKHQTVEIENNQPSLLGGEVANVDSPIVTGITKSISDQNNKIIKINRNKKVIIKNIIAQSDDDLKYAVNEFVQGTKSFDRLETNSAIDKCDANSTEHDNIKDFILRNGIKREDLQFYRKGSSKMFKYKEVSFKLGGGDKELIVGVITVPTAHGGLVAAFGKIEPLVSKEFYKALNVVRIDYQIVIHGIGHKELNRRLIVDRVKSIAVYRYQTKELTRYHGMKPCMTVIYHMLKRHGIDAVKVEVRTWGKYIGVTHPDQIKDWLLRGEFNPFENIKILNYDFKSNNRKRMIQFNTLADVLGVQFAKLYLNKNCNFARDFDPIIYAKKPILMSDIWKVGVKQYFEKAGEICL